MCRCSQPAAAVSCVIDAFFKLHVRRAVSARPYHINYATRTSRGTRSAGPNGTKRKIRHLFPLKPVSNDGLTGLCAPASHASLVRSRECGPVLGCSVRAGAPRRKHTYVHDTATPLTVTHTLRESGMWRESAPPHPIDGTGERFIIGSLIVHGGRDAYVELAADRLHRALDGMAKVESILYGLARERC